MLGICFHSETTASARSGSEDEWWVLARSVRSNSSQRCLVGFRSGLCAGQSSSFTLNSVNNVFYGSCYVYRGKKGLSLSIKNVCLRRPCDCVLGCMHLLWAELKKNLLIKRGCLHTFCHFWTKQRDCLMLHSQNYFI